MRDEEKGRLYTACQRGDPFSMPIPGGVVLEPGDSFQGSGVFRECLHLS